MKHARSTFVAMIGIVVFMVAGSVWPPSALVATNATGIELSHYEIAVAFVPESRTIGGTIAIDWLNATGQDQESVFLRLYPNARHYADGQSTVAAVVVDGMEVQPRSGLDPTVLEVPLGQDVAAGNHVAIELTFETVIPTTSDAALGMLGGSVENGWWLADWYPILAGWEEGTGWYLAAPTRFGDPTFAESATYDLALTMPEGLEVLGSGTTVAMSDDPTHGESTILIATGPGRDLTLSVFPTRQVDLGESVTREIAGFDVRVTMPELLAIPGLAGAIIDIASETLPVYEEWLGEYPHAELDITTAPLAGALAVAWNGIIWLDLEQVAADGQLSVDELAALRFTLGHELSHQWIAGIVGSNNNDHGFMSEGLANILSVLAIRERFGISIAGSYLHDWVASGYVAMVAGGEDGIADAPIADGTDIAARSRLIYGKAALGFEAIRQAIGDEAFFAGLADYAFEYRFAISEPVDLEAAFEDASGVNISSLWAFWFRDDTATTADVEDVLDGFAGS